MPTFEAGDVVKVPFSYTDRSTRQRRPALVLASGVLAERHGLLWLLMITSAANRRWAGDVEIQSFSQVGLPVASLVRTAKVATIDARDVAPLGRIDGETMSRVRREVDALLES